MYLSASRKFAGKRFSRISVGFRRLFCPKLSPFRSVRREVIPQHLRLRELLLAALVLAEVRLLALVNDLQVAIQIVDSGHDQRTPLLCKSKPTIKKNLIL